ncbi:hypothetical protein AMECASPLE_024093 [Ameca splendens]|uniref:Uncharacterized protein n=1 Tax=Ameca splendens TaxID=208324 RepID=A0ABV1AAJ6_9TELE
MYLEPFWVPSCFKYFTVIAGLQDMHLHRDVRQDPVCGHQPGLQHHQPRYLPPEAHPAHSVGLHLSVDHKLPVIGLIRTMTTLHTAKRWIGRSTSVVRTTWSLTCTVEVTLDLQRTPLAD